MDGLRWWHYPLLALWWLAEKCYGIHMAIYDFIKRKLG